MVGFGIAGAKQAAQKKPENRKAWGGQSVSEVNITTHSFVKQQNHFQTFHGRVSQLTVSKHVLVDEGQVVGGLLVWLLTALSVPIRHRIQKLRLEAPPDLHSACDHGHPSIHPGIGTFFVW